MISDIGGGSLVGGAGAAGRAKVRARVSYTLMDSEPMLATTERFSWESRRFLTAVTLWDAPAATWRLAATVRAFSDRDANRSQLVWHGIADSFDALEAIREAFNVPAVDVFIETGGAFDEARKYCAKHGGWILHSRDRWDFLHYGKSPRVRLPYSEAFTSCVGTARWNTREWSVPTFGGQLWMCHERGAHKWLLPASTPRRYLTDMEHGQLQFRATRPRNFQYMMAGEQRRALAPWVTESMQLAAAAVEQCTSMFCRGKTGSPA